MTGSNRPCAWPAIHQMPGCRDTSLCEVRFERENQKPPTIASCDMQADLLHTFHKAQNSLWESHICHRKVCIRAVHAPDTQSTSASPFFHTRRKPAGRASPTRSRPIGKDGTTRVWCSQSLRFRVLKTSHD